MKAYEEVAEFIARRGPLPRQSMLPQTQWIRRCKKNTCIERTPKLSAVLP